MEAKLSLDRDGIVSVQEAQKEWYRYWRNKGTDGR